MLDNKTFDTKNCDMNNTIQVEIGLTYEEIAMIGQLRKPGCKGPYSTFLELLTQWDHLSLEQVCGWAFLN